MSRAFKKPPKAPSAEETAEAPNTTPSKLQVQFGPSVSAPGSRLKRPKGA